MKKREKKLFLYVALVGVYICLALGMCYQYYKELSALEESLKEEKELPQKTEDDREIKELLEKQLQNPREREYKNLQSTRMYAGRGQGNRYMESDDLLLKEEDTVSLLEKYQMPGLIRMAKEDRSRYMDGLQVLKRVEVLGYDPFLMYTPEYDWKEIYTNSISRVEEATLYADVVTFEGTLASELNLFLEENTGVTVEFTSPVLYLDETIHVPSNVALEGKGILVRPNWENDAADTEEEKNVEYAMLMDRVQGTAIYDFCFSGGAEYGLYFIESRDCLVFGNQITGMNRKGLCIMGENRYVNIVNNGICENGHGALFLDGDIAEGIIQGNLISNNRGTRNLTAGMVLSSMPVEDPYNPYQVFPDEYLYEQTKAPHRLVIMENVIQDNYSSGIYCDGGYLNYIMGNVIKDNEKEGMCLDYGCFGTYVSKNTIRRNGERNRQTDEDLEADFVLFGGRLADGSSPFKLPGVSIDNSAYNIISDNIISDNSGSGVKIVRSGYRNLILSNVINDNNRGKNENFHGFGIELGHASEPDEPVIGLDFTAAYENIVARNTVSGAHYSGIFLADGSYCNDLMDNVVMGAECFSFECHSSLYNGSAGNTTNVPTLGYELNR